MDRERAWRFAELLRQGSVLSAFVAACADGEERAREARELGARVFAADPADLEAVEGIVETLTEWAEELADHPHRPDEPRPDEADRQVRDFLKDVLRDELSSRARDWMSRTELALEVNFLALRGMRTPAPRTREDAFYLYGRATMALDLGYRAAAERGAESLRELRRTHEEAGP
ncbi:hypothetical protein [Streptomyces macrosporus]|uniref:Uncharacterized protein n=1 Tax=Streptomyces macrosporus TaxID=44032 RepID=A0ABN3K7Q3_9ACTN